MSGLLGVKFKWKSYNRNTNKRKMIGEWSGPCTAPESA